MLSNSVDGLLSNVLVVRDVEGQQGCAVLDKSNQARIGEVPAVGQGESLNPGADRQRLDATVIDLVGEGGKIQAPNEIPVAEEGFGKAKGLANAAVVLPVCARGPVPQQVDRVACPSFADEHGVIEVVGGTQFRKDADEDLVG